MTITLADPLPCRLCHRPAWGADEHGPVHPCCVYWVAHGARFCLACAESAAAAREYARRHPYIEE